MVSDYLNKLHCDCHNAIQLAEFYVWVIHYFNADCNKYTFSLLMEPMRRRYMFCLYKYCYFIKEHLHATGKPSVTKIHNVAIGGDNISVCLSL